MSVTSCNELPLERRGPVENRDGKMSTSYIRVFQVETSSASDGPKTVRSYASIPNIGDVHNEDASARCVSVEPRPTSRLRWKVFCRYSIEKQTYKNVLNEDPTKQPPQIEFNFVTFTKSASKAYRSDLDDIGGTMAPASITQGTLSVPVRNTAGSPMPDMTEKGTMLMIRIRQNERSFDPLKASEYVNTINTTAITIASLPVPAYCGYLSQFSAKKAWDKDGKAYWQIHYEIAVNHDTHYRKVPNRGWQLKDEDSDTGLAEIKLKDGKRPSSACYIDEDGTAVVNVKDGEEPVYIRFQTLFDREWKNVAFPRKH